MDVINEIVWHSFLMLLWAGSVIAIFLGAGLLWVPQTVGKVNGYLARWIDTKAPQASLDRPHRLERQIYRHHRIVGLLLCLGAIFVFYRFLLSPIKPKIAILLVNDVLGLFDALSAMFVIGSVLAASIGIIMFFKPSMLREIESGANQWISVDKLFSFFSAPSFSLDRHVLKRRKIFGCVLLAAGLYVAVLLGWLLINNQWRL